MAPVLIFLHGWGYDGAFWNPLCARLADFRAVRWERGYFGAPACTEIPEGPAIAVGHSLGAMALYAQPPRGCVGLVAINGFDCFAAHPGFPGVPVRTLDRMRRKLEMDTSAVVRDFRERLGDRDECAAPDVAQLAQGLETLRDLDARRCGEGRALPVLALDGGADPLVLRDMRAASFAEASLFERRERPGGGHLLPLTDPDWCAQEIRAFAARL